MGTNFGRVSENVLFSLLLVSLVGWTAAQVAAGSNLASPDRPALATTSAVHRS
jgi:hypothetical protein